MAYSPQGLVSADLLPRRFQSLGHVLTPEPAQLAEFGIEASDLALLRLVRDIARRHATTWTRRLRDALDPLGIALHNHLVIGHGKHASFRSLGLL